MLRFLTNLFTAKPSEGRSPERAAHDGPPERYWPDLPEPPLLFRIAFIAIAVLTLAAAFAMGDDCGPHFAVPFIVEQLHDADSPVVTLACARGLRVEHVHIRAYGYDAFEVDHTRRTVNVTEIEIQRGVQARDALADLLKHGQLFAEDAHLSVGKVKDDPYGRWLAVLWVRTNEGEWINLEQWAEDNHHIREPRHVTRATGGVP